MPSLKTYDLFISHAWKYNDDYIRLINLLSIAPMFSYRNYSAPEDKPLHNLDSTDVSTKSEIKSAIQRKIAPVNAVIVVSGMYYNNREWMQYEMDTAKSMCKPIIAIKPYGNLFVPQEVMSNSNVIVNWSTDSIVSAIRSHSL